MLMFLELRNAAKPSEKYKNAPLAVLTVLRSDYFRDIADLARLVLPENRVRGLSLHLDQPRKLSLVLLPLQKTGVVIHRCEIEAHCDPQGCVERGLGLLGAEKYF